MQGIIIAPEQMGMATADFPDDERKRLEGIYQILKTDKISVIPFDNHLIWHGTDRLENIPLGKSRTGFCLNGGQVILGRGIIFGVNSKTGEDTDCTLDIMRLAKVLRSECYVRYEEAEN